jgi:outer membrane usher protein
MRSALWLLALAASICGGAAQSQTPVPQAFELTLNGESRGTVLLLQQGNEFLIAQDDARSWRLRMPGQPELAFRGQPFNTLSALGLTVSRLDLAAQKIELRAEPAAFESSTLTLSSLEYRVTPAAWGGYAAYDFIATHAGGRSAADGAFSVAGFAPFGSLTHQIVGRNLWADDDARRDFVRIATTFRHDWADRLISLELGDTVSRPGATGRALRYGGLNIGTNFGLRPGFIRQPLPEITGEASLPSTVEVFVQNQLRSVSSVPAGPFTLDNVPVISGAGDARVVVRDALGREQVVTSSFYVAGGLLRPGLTEWHVATGRLRDDRGGAARYGRDYATGLIRTGVTPSLTVEARAEFEDDRSAAVGGAANLGGVLGEFEATAALADVERVGRRGLLGAGYRYTTFGYNVGLRWQQVERGFRQAGDTDADPTPRRVVTVNAGGRLSQRWSGGAAWLEVERQNGERVRSVNASAHWSITAGATLLFAYNRVSEGNHRRAIGSVIASFALGDGRTAHGGADFGSERRQFVALQRSLPFDEGWGYRAAATHSSARTRAEAGLAVNLPAATVSGELVDESRQRAAGRLSVAGSIALIEDTAFAARQINDSFALVRIPGVAGAPIFLNNQPAGTTDAEGRLVLPRVMAYVPNEIRVDVDGLPPDAEITRDRETAVPPLRSGVVVTLGVRRTAAALVRVTRDGTPVGIGAAVVVEPDGTATSVAQGGAFFVRADSGRKRAIITERGARCVVEFELAPTDVGAYRTLGPYVCVP